MSHLKAARGEALTQIAAIWGLVRKPSEPDDELRTRLLMLHAFEQGRFATPYNPRAQEELSPEEFERYARARANLAKGHR